MEDATDVLSMDPQNTSLVYKLTLEYSQSTDINNCSIYNKYPNVQDLTITNTIGPDFTFTCNMSGMSALTHLTISNNLNLTVITHTLLHEVYGLITLDLSRNGVQNMPTFVHSISANLVYLTALNLASSNINTFQVPVNTSAVSMFEHLDRVSILLLTSNPIRDATPQNFSNMKLRKLTMDPPDKCYVANTSNNTIICGDIQVVQDDDDGLDASSITIIAVCSTIGGTWILLAIAYSYQQYLVRKPYTKLQPSLMEAF